MNDLIPTTAHVRDAYSAESSDSRYSNRMFDLWLAKYKAKTIAKERERIISLIEEYGSEDFTSDLIALIKGEQK